MPRQSRPEIAQVEERKARLKVVSADRDKLRQAQLARATVDEQAVQQQAVLAGLRELPEALSAILDRSPGPSRPACASPRAP